MKNFFFENLYKGSSNMHEISLRTEKILYENAIGSSGSSTTMKLPALSLCLCPTGRDASFIVCPTYSNFTSVTLTRYSWHERWTFFSRALKPGRQEWIASVRRLWRDFFFAHRENIGPLTKLHSTGAADIWSPPNVDLHDRDRIAFLRRLWR